MTTTERTLEVPHRAGVLRRAFAQTRYDTVTLLRNGEQLLLTFLLPLGALLAPAVLSSAWPVNIPEDSRWELSLAGALALAVLSTGLVSQSIALAFDRRWGVLRMLATTPLGRGGLIAGRMGSVAVMVALQVTVLCGAAAIGGWRPDWSAAGPVIGLGLVTVVMGAVAMTSLGLILGGTLRPEAVLAIANLAWALLAFAGGVIIPVDALPDVVAHVAQLLPSGALGEGLRSLAQPGPFAWGALIVLVAWAAGLVLLAVRTVSWDE